jgi:hypothetical protein
LTAKVKVILHLSRHHSTSVTLPALFICLFRGFIEKTFPWVPADINFGRNHEPMETLSNILASFDIFQVIISAFPQIFNPIIHAFQGIYTMIADIAGKMFESHPGLISGTVIFLLIYATYSGLSRLRRTIVSAQQSSPKRSL